MSVFSKSPTSGTGYSFSTANSMQSGEVETTILFPRSSKLYTLIFKVSMSGITIACIETRERTVNSTPPDQEEQRFTFYFLVSIKLKKVC